jgi:4,5-dihydroxyphthalate decarboxylase
MGSVATMVATFGLAVPDLLASPGNTSCAGQRRWLYHCRREPGQETDMPKLRLSFVSQFNERVEPLMDGTVEPEGLELIPTYSHPSETFWRQLKYGEFEIAEMSLSSYLIVRSRGPADMVALPVFPSRQLFQTWLAVHVEAGVREPSDLVGKRIGVAEYQQTAALWLRGILEHDFGVSQFKVDWYMERTEELSHGGATGFTPPPGISFHRIPPDRSMASMLVAHELDAAAINTPWARAASILDRSSRLRGQEADWGKVRPLFADPIAEGTRFLKKHGFMTPNHTYIIRGDVHRTYPWVAFNLYAAFVKAKALAREKLAERIPSALFFGPEYLAMTRTIVGDDPFPYGVAANRPMLERLIDYSYAQGLTARKLKVEELFAESTLGL